MSLLWIEGFESLGTNVDNLINTVALTRKYSSTSGLDSAYLKVGRTGGYAVEGSYNVGINCRTWSISPTSDTFIAGMAIRPSTDCSALTFFRFERDSYVGIRLRYESASGEIGVYNSAGSLLGTSSGANITNGNWSYVEVKVKDDYEGTIEVRVDGITVYTQTGVDTRANQSTGYNGVRFYVGATGTEPVRLDDFYFCNAAGTVNNDFLGDSKVVALYPASDGDLAQWVPSVAGDHWPLVDDNPVTDDTDYVSGTTSGDRDLWNYEEAVGLGTIAGIQINTVLRKEDSATYPTVKHLVKSGEMVYEYATPLTIYITYGFEFTVSQVDPALSPAGPWTVDSLNAAQFGVKRV